MTWRRLRHDGVDAPGLQQEQVEGAVMLTKPRRPVEDSYFDLVREFPLVSIKNERHYDEAVAFLKTLAIRDENTLDDGEKDYLEALTRFVEDYEIRHYRAEIGRMKPLEALKFLMKQNDMKSIDLGKLLGNRSLASQILHGKRGLSRAHIRLLAGRFKVEPGLFFD
jgi:HTH-type transcriptional regulator / antitoxin HigA